MKAGAVEFLTKPFVEKDLLDSIQQAIKHSRAISRQKAETERLNDLPDGDWRRVQKAEGYRYTLVNGEITFEDSVCTGALPGKVLRSCDIGA